jgi:branched-chain amino acid transport system substrate-binding protein
MKTTNIARLGGLIAAVGLTTAALMAVAQAQAPAPLKIAVMDGFSGVYGDLTAGEVEAMQMAIEDVGG